MLEVMVRSKRLAAFRPLISIAAPFGACPVKWTYDAIAKGYGTHLTDAMKIEDVGDRGVIESIAGPKLVGFIVNCPVVCTAFIRAVGTAADSSAAVLALEEAVGITNQAQHAVRGRMPTPQRCRHAEHMPPRAPRCG